MKKRIFTVIIGVFLLIFGTILASLPRLTLKCDGWNCVLYKNYFGQVIQAKSKFTYQDIRKCEVKPVNTLGENGELSVKGFTLRLDGEGIKFSPEWKNKDSAVLSEVCNAFFKRQPVKYSESGIFEILRGCWWVFILVGIWLIVFV